MVEGLILVSILTVVTKGFCVARRMFEEGLYGEFEVGSKFGVLLKEGRNMFPGLNVFESLVKGYGWVVLGPHVSSWPKGLFLLSEETRSAG